MALSTYSEQNPRVIRLRSVVERLEAIVASQTSLVAQEEGAEPATTPEQAMFRATMLEMDSRIEALTADIETTQNELERLQGDISSSSVNGIQLNALERDFDAIQVRYNAALNNLNSAQMSERIETTAQGQRITIIENANVPQVPTGPSRPRIIAMACAVGLALSGGFFALLEFMNRTVRRPAELTGRFDITPIAIIPYMESPRRRAFRRLGLIIATLIVVIGVPLGLWYIDQHFMPLNLLIDKVLTRLGFS